MSEYWRAPRRPFTRGLDGKVSRVLVAEWPEQGVELARVGVDQDGRNPTFEVCADGRYSQELYQRQRGSQIFSFRIPVNPKNEKCFLPYLRWAAAVLGVTPPRQSPFPSADTFHAVDNPFVGAFLQRTTEELLRDALLFDEVMVEWLDRDFSEDGARVMPLLLPSTTTHPPILDHYPSSYRELPTFCDGSFSVEVVSYGRGATPMVNVKRPGSFGTSREVDGKRSRSVHELVTWFQGMNRDPSQRRSNDTPIPSWLLLPADDADRWWSENTRPGQLCLPEEELEVFRALGEDLPFCWENDRLRAWAEERWPSPEF